jgi:hypothetical protein
VQSTESGEQEAFNVLLIKRNMMKTDIDGLLGHGRLGLTYALMSIHVLVSRFFLLY